MTKYGVRVTQDGVDVKHAPDYQKVLDSDFPTIEIFDVIDIDSSHDMITAAGTLCFTPVYKHGLGYIPAFEWYSSDNTSILTGDYELYSYQIGADDQYFYIKDVGTGLPPKTMKVKGKLVIYQRNLREELAPTPASISPASQGKSSFGLKDLKDGKRMDSNELSDFSVNTHGKMMNIHMSGTIKVDAGTNYEANITHNLGYLPAYLTYDLQDKDSYFGDINSKNLIAYQIGPGYGDFYHGLTPPLRSYGDQRKLRFTGVQSVYVGVLAYIIFKDPITGIV